MNTSSAGKIEIPLREFPDFLRQELWEKSDRCEIGPCVAVERWQNDLKAKGGESLTDLKTRVRGYMGGESTSVDDLIHELDAALARRAEAE